MTSSDQPFSNSPKCETCGETERYPQSGLLRYQHVRPFGEGSDDHAFQPAPLFNSEGVQEARQQVVQWVVAGEREVPAMRATFEETVDALIDTVRAESRLEATAPTPDLDALLAEWRDPLNDDSDFARIRAQIVAAVQPLEGGEK